MAKVSDIKFTFNGIEQKVPVNVGVDGIFKTELPEQVATALKLKRSIASKKLEDIRQEFYNALERYKNSETTQQLFIAVKYSSCGKCSNGANGYPLFNGWNSPYNLDARDGINAVGLTFKVVLCETIDGVTEWYETRDRDGEREKGQVFYSKSSWKIIDYHEIYVETLSNAIENMRKVSEMLFKFIEQDTSQMQLTLSKGKLLLGE